MKLSRNTYLVKILNLGKLVENNSPKTTRQKQLTEIKGRKPRRKATRRKHNSGKLVEYQSELTSVKQIIDSAIVKYNIQSKRLRGRTCELIIFDSQ